MKKHDDLFDIFISYRREDGFSTAQLFYERLTQMGYRVSFDVETLRSGDFNTQLYKRIENCKDFVVIVSKEALHFRDKPEHDWLRLEVAHALKCGKNIIPVFLREVKAPPKDELPEDIADFVMKNGVAASDVHFDSTINKLCRLLHARKQIRKKIFAGILALLVTAVAAAGGFCLNHDWTPAAEPVPAEPETKHYPATNEEKQEFSQIFNYLVFQISNVNLTGYYYEKYLAAAEAAVLTGDMETFKDEKAYYENSLKNIKSLPFKENFVEMAQRSNAIDAGDLQLFPQIYDHHLQFMTRNADNISDIISPQSMIAKGDQLKLVRIKREWGKILTDNMGMTFIALLYKVHSPVLDDFKKINVPQLTSLPVLSATWPTGENEIIRLLNQNSEKLKVLLQEESVIVGNMNREKNMEEKQLREQMKQQGMTDEEIERIMQKHNELSRMKTKLRESQNQLKEIQQKAREKFAPKPEDDEGTLWSKMVALRKSSLPADALQLLDMIRKKNSKMIPESVCRVTEKILKTPQDLPFVNGVIVCFFEEPATSHAIFQPGDVITKVNDKDCMSYQDFRTAEGIKYVLFRLNKNGTFEKVTCVMPEKQPRTAVAELPF